MELSFVIKALQRRWWIIVLFSLLGAVAGSLVAEDESTEFRSDAVLAVSPPTSATTILTGDPDRYVQGQLAVLASQSLIAEVAIIVGLQPIDIAESISFEQVGDTDVVVVTAESPNGAQAQVVAQAYAETYVATQRANVTESQQPDIDALNELLRQKEDELRVVNATIEERMRAFVLNPPVPPVDAIVPEEAALRQLLIDDINRIQLSLTAIETTGRQQVNTFIVQDASTPLAVENSNSSFIVGGYILGAMLGVVVAMVWAQFSPYLIDEVSTTDVTGQATVGTVTRSRVMRTNPLLASQQARGRTPQTLAQLAVRSEALGTVTRPLVIVSVGPRVGAGATSMSLAMAGRFAQQGSLVTVLDADDRDRTLSRSHALPELGGLSELVACIEQERNVNTDAVLSPTELGGVNIIGQGEELTVLRRANTQAVVQTAAQFGDVLIIDGGPLLGSAAVIEACRHADAIVLSVPLQRQLRGQLADVVAQLGADRSKLLTVINEPVPERAWQRIFATG